MGPICIPSALVFFFSFTGLVKPSRSLITKLRRLPVSGGMQQPFREPNEIRDR